MTSGSGGPGWLRSLALRTDLLLLDENTEITVSGGWIAVRTASFPSLRLGNALLFPRPPTAADVPTWLDLLLAEVGHSAEVHSRLAWEGGKPTADTYKAFRSMGFEPYNSLSMLTTCLPSREDSVLAPVRQAKVDSDWIDLLDFQRRSSEALGEPDECFLTQRLDMFRRQAQDGAGAWYTAYRGDQVIGCCGVVAKRGVGRLQQLEVSNACRRRGVASSLVVAAGEWAFQHKGVTQLVAVADPDYHAAKMFST
jgi:ribosomal protein S18 acetylase RimI-like enzyme